MAIALRVRNATSIDLTPIADLVVQRVSDPAVMAQLQGRPETEMRRRVFQGHRAYVAYHRGVPAAFGWVATRVAEIGELKAHFEIPPRVRYLWNFVTLKSHRGLGIYPRLLNSIVEMETDARVFWIAYAPENRASRSGILKAGFTDAAEMSFDQDARPRVGSIGEFEMATAASRLVGLPLAGTPLTPCWKCVRAGRSQMACAEGSCRCDYQRAETTCASDRETGRSALA